MKCPYCKKNMSQDGDSNICLSLYGICPIYSLTISNGKVKSMTARSIKTKVKSLKQHTEIKYDSPNIMICIYS